MNEEEKQPHSHETEGGEGHQEPMNQENSTEEGAFKMEDGAEENKSPVGPLIGIILIIVIIVLGAIFFWTQDEIDPMQQEEEPVAEEEEMVEEELEGLEEELEGLEEELNEIDEEFEDEEEEE